ERACSCPRQAIASSIDLRTMDASEALTQCQCREPSYRRGVAAVVVQAWGESLDIRRVPIEQIGALNADFGIFEPPKLGLKTIRNVQVRRRPGRDRCFRR